MLQPHWIRILVPLVLIALSFLFTLFILFFAWVVLKQEEWARKNVHRWAENEGFSILHCEIADYLSQPFLFVNGNRRVFKLTLVDGQGRKRRCWVLSSV